MTRIMQAILVLPAAVFAVGCGDSNMGQVHGTVTYKGKPVHPGVVQFYPASGAMAFGGLDENGQFSLTTKVEGDGALAGPHQVVVTPYYPAVGDTDPDVRSLNVDPKNIPERYRSQSTTPLTLEVVADETTEVTFELTE